MSSKEANLVSIIIPVYNRKDIVIETLKSLLNQTYECWEAIVVDDGSIDGSLDVLREFETKDKRIKIFSRNRQPKGAQTCRNIGLENSTGDWIMFLDSDDLLAEFCLEQRVKYMEENPELDFAVFPVLIFDKEPGDSLILWNVFTKENDLDRFIRYDVVWQTTSPIFKRNFVRKLRWDEMLLSAQDWDFHLKALAESPKYNKVETIPDCFIRRDNKNNRISLRFFEPKEIFNRIPSEQKIIELLKRNNLWKKDFNNAIASLYYNLAKELIYNHKDFEFNLIKFLNPLFKNRLVGLKDYLITLIYVYGLKKYRNNDYKRKKLKQIMARFFPGFFRFKVYSDTLEKIKLEGKYLKGFTEKFYNKSWMPND